ncbi:MAG: CheR family methyltransferase [Bacteroidia bacterium]
MNNFILTEYDNLLIAINEKHGLNLREYARASMERRLDRFVKLNHIQDMEGLSQRIINDPEYYDYFIKEITVNTTEMFRDPGCWKELRNTVLPLLSDLPSIRIWHAGCSSGEEVFSMAILLKELNLYDRTKIVATDLNKDILQRAKSGEYSLKALQLNKENYKLSGGNEEFTKYFTSADASYKMNSELLENVTFLKHDLSSGNPFSKFDLILCRNVLIYFNKQLQESVFDLFTRSLFKKGFLLIGKKESMAYFSKISQFSEYNFDEKIYRAK